MEELCGKICLQLLHCAIVFGVPILIFAVWINRENKKIDEKEKENSDRVYREVHGEEAYTKLCQARQAPVWSSIKDRGSRLINTEERGVWFSKHNAWDMQRLVELNHEQALIGIEPYRLSSILSRENQTVLKGVWTNSNYPEFETTVCLRLKFKDIADGCAVYYDYRVSANDAFAPQVLKITNFWLRGLIEKKWKK